VTMLRAARSPLVALLLGATACSGSAPSDAERSDSGGIDAPASTALPPDGEDSLSAAAARLTYVLTEPVEGWTGPGGEPFELALRTPGDSAHLYAAFGNKMFPLPLRISERTLSRYPCASCHQGAIVQAGTSEEAHANIEPTHPPELAGNCAACHVPGAVDRLALSGGETASLDQAYRLCAGCHAAQVESWAGGAHGKRLQTWSGRRVVMSCADCHDPHRPVLAARLPYPGPRLPRAGGPHP